MTLNYNVCVNIFPLLLSYHSNMFCIGGSYNFMYDALFCDKCLYSVITFILVPGCLFHLCYEKLHGLIN
jgi:hypothetical protein